MAKILYLDIETAPKLAYVWAFWKQNIQPKAVLEHGHIMSFSAIWNDDTADKIVYHENRTESDRAITSSLIDLLDQADVVIGQNVDKFDLGYIRGRAIVNRLLPPSPYKTVDTYKVAKNELNMGANSLEYLCEVFNVPIKKKNHSKFPGFELWLQCMKQNEEAWNEMREYNIDDTLSVRELYKVMRPYIRNHCNVAIFDERDHTVCPVCGSRHVVKRGYYYSSLGRYQRYRCHNCGSWSRARINDLDKEKRNNLLVVAR